MINILKAAMRWLVDGLCEAAMAVIAGFDRRPTYRVDVAAGCIVADDHGLPLGRLAGADGAWQLQPADLGTRLSEAIVSITVPTTWIWRRSLPPIGVEGMAYLDAFVGHHVERISPWPSTDIYRQTRSRPLDGDPTRLAIDVGIVPRRLVDPIVAAVKPHAAGLLLTGSGSEHDALSIPIDEKRHAYGKTRRIVVATLLLLCLAPGAWLAVTAWQAAATDAQIMELDQQIAARRRLAADPRGMARDPAEALWIRRASQAFAVELIDTLARTLPDSAYLIELHLDKAAIAISGITSRPSELVPALEGSGRFADVRFAAATTRIDDGRLDRFQLEMRSATNARDGAP